MHIPFDELSEQALIGVIDAFVLREGTDYGHRDYTLEEKRARVLRMLEQGVAHIQFCPTSQHIEIQIVDP